MPTSFLSLFGATETIRHSNPTAFIWNSAINSYRVRVSAHSKRCRILGTAASTKWQWLREQGKQNTRWRNVVTSWLYQCGLLSREGIYGVLALQFWFTNNSWLLITAIIRPIASIGMIIVLQSAAYLPLTLQACFLNSAPWLPFR
jgi:hypothetical protein